MSPNVNPYLAAIPDPAIINDAINEARQNNIVILSSTNWTCVQSCYLYMLTPMLL